MINNVVLVGRMTRDAELRYTPSNVAVASRVLMVNVKLTLLTVLSGASKLKIWRTGLRKAH